MHVYKITMENFFILLQNALLLLQLLTIGKTDPLTAVTLHRHFANGYKNIFQSLNFLKMVRKFGKSFQINLNLDVYV